MSDYEIWFNGSHIKTNDKEFARAFLRMSQGKKSSLDVRGPEGVIGKTCIPEMPDVYVKGVYGAMSKASVSEEIIDSTS